MELNRLLQEMETSWKMGENPAQERCCINGVFFSMSIYSATDYLGRRNKTMKFKSEYTCIAHVQTLRVQEVHHAILQLLEYIDYTIV